MRVFIKPPSHNAIRLSRNAGRVYRWWNFEGLTVKQQLEGIKELLRLNAVNPEVRHLAPCTSAGIFAAYEAAGFTSDDAVAGKPSLGKVISILAQQQEPVDAN